MDISRTITIGAGTHHSLTIKRLGYGTMRLTGDHVWGEPENRNEALQILRSAANHGINFLDTADYYGDDVTNRLIEEAIYPYPDDMVICTKVGAGRKADKSWQTSDKPENLRTSIERNLKTLKIEQIKLVHFRITSGSDTPLEDSMGTLFEMQKEGKILHVGISNASREELKRALAMGKIASVENAFGYGQRTSFNVYRNPHYGMQEVMELCNVNEIPMIPFWSLQNSLSKDNPKISVIAKKYHATPAQINIAWLLHYNNLLLPIPGTSKLKHFEENIEAFDISLTADDMKFLG
jgi:pyridoxine 4-dehydrogenase